MDISIVIVNYKSKGLTLNCIKAIEEASFADLQYEIIVVDNNSGDNLGEILAWQYPKVLYIQNERNFGMGAGNNTGLKRARGHYVVVMNPDTLAFKDTFIQLHQFMEENPTVGIAGPKQYNPDKSVQDSCYRWHNLITPILRRTFLGNLGEQELKRFIMADYDKKKPRDVDWLLGSCLFIRTKALKDVGMFDERFFLYFEDTDLCRRFWKKHWRVTYVPQAQIIHNHNRESAKQPWFTFFLHQATRRHLGSWGKYIVKWGLATPDSH